MFPQNNVLPRLTKLRHRQGKRNLMMDTPVILIVYKRPEHTQRVLNALREHNIKKLFIFSDGPKNNGDFADVYETRLLLQKIDWTNPVIIEQDKNMGLSNSIVTAVNYVFDEFDRMILLEDDCVPQRYFFDFMETCLKNYENNPEVFGVSGYTVPLTESILKTYPYDAYFYPRIGSWGWATWKKAWRRFESNFANAYKRAIENNIDLSQGGTDVPLMCQQMLNGTLKNSWDTYWAISVYLNKGYYVYPTYSHIENIGMDGSGSHCAETGRFDAKTAASAPSKYPGKVILREDMDRNFRRYYDIHPDNAVGPLHSDRTARSLKVVHLCAQDVGGAGNAAYRLHKGLQMSGVQSTLLVVNKQTEDPSVKVVYTPGALSGIKERWNAILARYPHRPEGLEFFSDTKSDIRLDLVREIQSAHIVHLHWAAGMIDYPRMPVAFKKKTVVWTLHDMNPFTGGCHYAGDCRKYRRTCGACPQLGSVADEDLSRNIWNEKSCAFRGLNINIVTPSRWMGECARESRLFSGLPVSVIPNGFPLDVFKPYPKAAARKSIGVSGSARVILFGADSIVNARKGFKSLISALNKFEAADSDIEVVFAFFGYSPEAVGLETECRILDLGPISDENRLAEIYSAADLFVIPSLEDNLPNTVIESMACGVPVVGFSSGGIPEMVEHRKTGYLVETGDMDGLIKGIKWVLKSHDAGIDFVTVCRQKAIAEYAMEVQAGRYVNLYHHIFQGSSDDSEEIETRVFALEQQGTELFERGDGNGALLAYKKALEVDPDNADIHHSIGVVYALKGDYDRASVHYHKAIRLQPHNIDMKKGLADFYCFSLGRIKDAMEIYLEVLSVRPRDTEILLVMGNICAAVDRFDDAKTFYQIVLDIEPWNKDAKRGLGL